MFFHSFRRLRFERCIALAALTFGWLPAGPTQVSAQAAPADNDLSVSGDGADTVAVMLLKDVPVGEPIAVTRALFDLGGYQIITQSGATIAIPFVNHNLEVMRFGRSTSGQPYFVNEGETPALYMPAHFSLENAAYAGTHWYPLPADYADPRPAYISMVPTWSDYTAMNWYAGMNYYGGLWGYSPTRITWIPISSVNFAGRNYTPNTYLVYSASHPGFRSTTHFNYYPSPPLGDVVKTNRGAGAVNTGHSTPHQPNSRAVGTTRPPQSPQRQASPMRQAPPQRSGPVTGRAPVRPPSIPVHPPKVPGAGSRRLHR